MMIKTECIPDCLVELATAFRKERRAPDKLSAVMEQAAARIRELEAESARLREACMKSNDEICQTLGKALGYPWFKDDQANFPGADEENGVCVGDHVAESIAVEAAARTRKLEAERERLEQDVCGASVTILGLERRICELEAHAIEAWNDAIEAAAHKATWGGWGGEACPADAIRKLKRETNE